MRFTPFFTLLLLLRLVKACCRPGQTVDVEQIERMLDEKQMRGNEYLVLTHIRDNLQGGMSPSYSVTPIDEKGNAAGANTSISFKTGFRDPYTGIRADGQTKNVPTTVARAILSDSRISKHFRWDIPDEVIKKPPSKGVRIETVEASPKAVRPQQLPKSDPIPAATEEASPPPLPVREARMVNGDEPIDRVELPQTGNPPEATVIRESADTDSSQPFAPDVTEAAERLIAAAIEDGTLTEEDKSLIPASGAKGKSVIANDVRQYIKGKQDGESEV